MHHILSLTTAAALAALITNGAAAQTRTTLDIYVVDVEGGNATLFVPPSGESVLIDTGNVVPAAVRDADRIMAAVKDAGLTQIDHLITTHWHNDHFGAMAELAKRIPIRHFVDHGPTVQSTPIVDEFLGKTYPEGGVEQGQAVLADIARHPATAAHVAFKLARHFSADEPSPSLLELLSKRFIETDGDLKEIAKALIEAPETWDEQRLKLKRPSEWLISCWRAIGAGPAEARRVLDSHAYLGERFWRPNAPKGFADEQSAWMDGLSQRLDIANRIGELVQARVEPAALLENSLGPLCSEDTRKTIARAESRQQAITLTLMAPEFQRR